MTYTNVYTTFCKIFYFCNYFHAFIRHFYAKVQEHSIPALSGKSYGV